MLPDWIYAFIISKYLHRNMTMKKTNLIFISLALILACCICAACGEVSEDMSASTSADATAKEIHVSIEGNDESGDGSIEKPFATPARAAIKTFFFIFFISFLSFYTCTAYTVHNIFFKYYERN